MTNAAPYWIKDASGDFLFKSADRHTLAVVWTRRIAGSYRFKVGAIVADRATIADAKHAAELAYCSKRSA